MADAAHAADGLLRDPRRAGLSVVAADGSSNYRVPSGIRVSYAIGLENQLLPKTPPL
jgi:hypothetical protein